MWKKLLALAFSVSFSVILLEGAVRQLDLAPPLPKEYRNFVADPFLAFRPRPNSVTQGWSTTGEFDVVYRFNSMGFRDEDHELEKPAGVFRILGLGDSFTVGVGADYEDTYLARLERLLNTRPGSHPKVEIVKAGIIAYGPVEERLLLERYGARYKPDLVTVAFVANDVMNAYHGIGHAQPTPDGYLLSGIARELGTPARWLYTRSHAGRALLRAYLERRNAPQHQGSWEDINQENGRHEADWQTVESEYLRMNEFTKRIGARFALIYVPQYFHEYPQRRLAVFAAKHKIPFIETQSDMAKAFQRGVQIYWPRDRHCTPAGYQVISEAIFRQLQQLALVP